MAISQTCEQNRAMCLDDSCKEQRLASRDGVLLIRGKNQILLQNVAGNRKAIFVDKKPDCSIAAGFISASRLYIEPCSGSAFIADQNGSRLYRMPKFKYWDIASDKSGSRFAIFERGRSFWHEFGQGTYDELRLIVYRTDGGKRLFERKWSADSGERPDDERIGLSDDGLALYLCRPNSTPVTFAIK